MIFKMIHEEKVSCSRGLGPHMRLSVLIFARAKYKKKVSQYCRRLYKKPPNFIDVDKFLG